MLLIQEDNLYFYKHMLVFEKKTPLSPETTFRIGGEAEFFYCAKTKKSLREAIVSAKENILPVVVLGGGSNVLVSDSGIEGLVLQIGIKGISYKNSDDYVYVRVGAGVVFDELIDEVVSKGYWGLENLSAIPGSVGATPVQNVGAYGVEVADIISEVEVYDSKKDEFNILTKEDCGFRYRHSIFKRKENKNLVVVNVTFRLSKKADRKLEYKDLKTFFESDSKPSAKKIRSVVVSIRSKKFPDLSKIGTAGSFFKNPIIDKSHYKNLLKKYPKMPSFEISEDKVKVPLGWILDNVLNIKGVSEGNVGMWEKQALVLVNYGGASSEDIKKFATNIYKKVLEATDIKIEWEVSELS